MTTAAGGPLSAQWAVLGKRQGEVMGYEVLDGSLPRDQAARYLWGSLTATPGSDRSDGPDALPWRVFLSAVEGEPTFVAARTETRWDGTRDGTGQPSYSTYLALLDWAEFSGAGLTWTTLDRAADAADWRLDGSAADARDSARLPLDVSPTTVRELADTVDRLGFDWAAGTAALLLDGRQVVITLPYAAQPPDVGRRVLILDAVCALLPYGCRVWLSAATWAGHRAEHRLSLVFALRARPKQQEVVLGGPVPPSPAGPTAAQYLSELRRLRAKKGTTHALVAHLLRAAAPLPYSETATALTVLQEIDLLDSVHAEAVDGRSNPARVSYVLQWHSAGADEAKVGDLLVYLAHCVVQPDRPGDADLARAALLAHWRPGLSGRLAADLTGSRPTEASFERAKQWLRLAREAEKSTRGPEAEKSTRGAFESLLRSVLDAEQPHDAQEWACWRAELIYAVQREFGDDTQVADGVLIESGDVGLRWLRHSLLEGKTFDRRIVERLARRQVPGNLQLASWPRFLGALAGVLPPAEARAEDAAQFAELGDRAWQVALQIAGRFRRAFVLDLLWSRLLDVSTAQGGAAEEDRKFLAASLRQLAPADASSDPEIAAAADLLEAGGRALPRLPAAATARERYVSALSRRLDSPAVLGGLDRPVVAALLGSPERPPPEPAWEALVALTERRPSLQLTVLDEIAVRLGEHEAWLYAALPDDWVHQLGRRPALAWLPAYHALRTTVASEPSAEDLSRAVCRAVGARSLSAPVLRELGPWLTAREPAAVDDLARRLDNESQGRRLGVQLYAALFADAFGSALREAMRRFDETEGVRRALIRAQLSERSRTPPTGAPSPSPRPPAVPANGGADQPLPPGSTPPSPAPSPAGPGPRTLPAGYQDIIRDASDGSCPPDPPHGHKKPSLRDRIVHKRWGRS